MQGCKSFRYFQRISSAERLEEIWKSNFRLRNGWFQQRLLFLCPIKWTIISSMCIHLIKARGEFETPERGSYWTSTTCTVWCQYTVEENRWKLWTLVQMKKYVIFACSNFSPAVWWNHYPFVNATAGLNTLLTRLTIHWLTAILNGANAFGCWSEDWHHCMESISSVVRWLVVPPQSTLTTKTVMLRVKPGAQETVDNERFIWP